MTTVGHRACQERGHDDHDVATTAATRHGDGGWAAAQRRPRTGRSVAILGLLSVYALVITMKGVKTAAEAEVAGYVNPEMPDEVESS